MSEISNEFSQIEVESVRVVFPGGGKKRGEELEIPFKIGRIELRFCFPFRKLISDRVPI